MTIAKLHPEGLSTIDLIPAGDPKTEDYNIDLGSLDLQESERLEIAYSEGANVDGGEAISAHGPLVPLTFDVIVQGSGVSEDAARQQLLQYAQALEAAICNAAGGTFEFKPDNLGAGVRSTFYHYVQSQPPKVRAIANNNWDAAPVETEPEYVCAIELEIELQTQPFATSDPNSPVSVLTATTVYNQDDAVAGHVTILAANVKGTISALVQLRVRNMVSGAWAAIEKFWYARRTEGTLANFAPVLEGGTADTDSSIHWSTESDTTRRSDNFQRYAPPAAANLQWASLNYTISNITDHEGKVAIAVVCRSLAEGWEDWDLKAALKVADVVVETGIKNVASVGVWTVCILGELDIPPTPISADESYATKLYLYFKRNAGDENNPIDVDFAQLLFVDEYPQQVNITDGFTNVYKLLMENFKRELCHIVDQSTLVFEKTAMALCPLLQLRPGKDNRIDFIWERLGGPYEVLIDGFASYEAWRWLKLASFEDSESWPEQGHDNTYYVEAAQGFRCTQGGTDHADKDVSWDLSGEGRFGSDDYVVLAIRRDSSFDPGASGYYYLYFHTTFPTDYYYKETLGSTLSVGWNFVTIKKSAFSTQGSPNWADINKVEIGIKACTAGFITFDDLRISKADPDDANRANDTGTVWDFMRDVWHIYELDSADKSLGCIDNTAGEQVALIHKMLPVNIKYLAKVRAKRDDGAVGLIFRCVDAAPGAENMAAFSIDTADDKLRLHKWAGGTPSDIATGLDQTTAPDTDYWLGVWILDTSTVRCYFGTSKAAIWDDEYKDFKAAARKFNVTNAVFASGGALASGKCGLLSISTLGRFDDVELYAVGDGHVPGDTVQVEAKAIYRTIYPFRE